MNKLDQIKYNLEHGLPIDSEETLSAIRELEQDRDELMARLNESEDVMMMVASADTKLIANKIASDWIDEQPTESLAEIQSKAISNFFIQFEKKTYWNKSVNDVIREGHEYANNLRQQAKEQQ